MMSSVTDSLRVICASPPEDLVRHFEDSRSSTNPELGIHLLDLQTSITYSQGIFRVAELGKRLEIVALNDANDSNPYCYITKGPLTGTILHFLHDDDPVIAYGSLGEFVKAISDSITHGVHIDDMSYGNVQVNLDRNRLVEHVKELLRTRESDIELWLYIPLLSTSETDLIKELAQNENFFTRESVAGLLEKNPNPLLLETVRLLASDPHPQVARIGKKALTSVNRMIHSSRQS
jgi:hypothetical protein